MRSCSSLEGRLPHGDATGRDKVATDDDISFENPLWCDFFAPVGVLLTGLRRREGHDQAMAGEPGAGQQPALDSEAALRRLFAEHGASVYRMARSVLRDPGLAEDVTQETFIKAWQHHDSYRGDAPILHWLLRIAHNLAVSTLRTIREESTDPGRLPIQEPRHPDDVVEGRLLIDEALDALDPLSRAVVVLREVEQLTYAEISDVLRVPMPTVKTRLFRARAQLRSSQKGGPR